MPLSWFTSWYAGGLAFECLRCGRCCSGPEEGYVWVTPEEVLQAARFLGVRPEEVHGRYVRCVSGRLSLTEAPGSRDCVFLSFDQAGCSICRIYPVRPTQCRTWPFWPANLASKSAWCRAGARCPGINRGRVHGFDEIEAQRKRINP